MITPWMKKVFGYRMILGDLTHFTPLKWNTKFQRLELSSTWEFLLWISNIFHNSCYVLFPSYNLLRQLWSETEVNRIEVVADFLFLTLGTLLVFLCMSTATQRSSHLQLTNSLFVLDAKLSSKFLLVTSCTN